MARKYKQGYDDRRDESLGERRGAERNFSQSYKDRRDESAGMDHYTRRMEDGNYMGMISSDYNAPANLPQDVKHEYYYECNYIKYDLDDSQKMINENIDDAVRRLRKDRPDSKY